MKTQKRPNTLLSTKALTHCILFALSILLLSSCALFNPPKPALTWKSCGARITNGIAGECATASVPLLWKDASSKSIDISVKRILTSAQTSKGQLWLLDGGPGGAGWLFERPEYPALRGWRQAGWDIYLYSHRGTGDSTRLSCKDENDDFLKYIEDCGSYLKAKWGDDLTGFTSYEAARDLHYLINESKETAKKISVLGISYGGYLAQRYQQLFPQQADSIVMDSPLPLGADVIQNGLLAEDVILEFYAECSKVARACAENFGNPVEALNRAKQQLDSANCPIANTGLSYGILQQFIQQVFRDPGTRMMAPAVIARINRCSESDIAELSNLLQNSSSNTSLQTMSIALSTTANTTPDDGDSDALGFNVSHLDITKAINPTALQDLYKDTLIVSANSVIDFDSNLWPSFPNYKRNDQQSKAVIPTLILSGGVDVQAPPVWQQDIANTLGLTAKHLQIFPTQGHFITISSECAGRMVLDFINNPNATLNNNCITPLSSIDFAGTTQQSQSLAQNAFGTNNFWGE